MITTKNAALTAEILSGSLYIILIVIAYLTHNADMLGKMQDLIYNHSNLLLSFGFAWFILAWLFGTFFDAFRDSVVENCKFKEKIN